MLNRLKVILAAFALMSSSAAFATIIPLGDGLYQITDEQQPEIFLTEGESHTVYHSLFDQGVPDDYWVLEGQLVLSFSESEDGQLWDLDYEWAQIQSEGVEEIVEVDGVYFAFHVIWVDLIDDAIDGLNGDGLLQATVTAIDNGQPDQISDFWWMGSTLKVVAQPIPEPGTLGLLGLGLLGLAGGRRLSRNRAA